MNPESTPPPPPPAAATLTPPPPLPPEAPPPLQPLAEGASFGALVDALLRSPASLLRAFGRGEKRIFVLLLGVALFSLAAFGLILGTFSGGTQLCAAPLKVVCGTALAAAICLPSLYIFGALGGLEARLIQIVGVLSAVLALVGVLLLGFAPVMWVFSASTESIQFMGLLALAFWMIAVIFGARLLHTLAKVLGLKSSTYLTTWVLIFLMVTLQMSTSLRPILGTAQTLLPTQKQFFLEHWFESLNETSGR